AGRSCPCEYAQSEKRSHGQCFLKALREGRAAHGPCRRRQRTARGVRHGRRDAFAQDVRGFARKARL
ncbi:MAG: hypothetical protein AVDCRST_MAG91-1712, partial [uncultured Sphingomonadaceae bacterium]